jgi:RimJ/RimL family protein N-acetyltransferase
VAGARRPPELLSGNGLTLSRWRESDLLELQVAVNASRAHLAPWMAWAGDESPSAVGAFLRESSAGWRRGERFEYGIWSEDGRTLLGSTGLMARLGPGGLEIGYWVGAAHTRRRVATRASAMLTAAAFAVPAIDRVEIHHDEANGASGGVPAALGFKSVGTFPRAPAGAPGETGREVRWRMRAPEFSESPAAALLAGS